MAKKLTEEQWSEKMGTAYQVIGTLLSKAGLFDTAEGERALDYFADDEAFDEDFLPWPQ